MNTQNPKGVIASLQSLGLIDEENKVTVQGLDVLTRYVANANNGEVQEEDWKPEYSHTCDMSLAEIEKWEQEEKRVSIPSWEGGRLEVSPTRAYCEDTGERVWDKHEMIHIVACNYDREEECYLSLYDKKEIIKLRDYLTKFIEKDKDWFDIEKFEENN